MGEGEDSACGSDQQAVYPFQRRGVRQSDESPDRTSAEMNRVYGNNTATMHFPEQTLPIRNERVNGSNPLSGSPLFRAIALLFLELGKLFHLTTLECFRVLWALWSGFRSNRCYIVAT
jgi:hypothetical protein